MCYLAGRFFLFVVLFFSNVALLCSFATDRVAADQQFEDMSLPSSLSHSLASFCLLYATLLVSCRGFTLKAKMLDTNVDMLAPSLRSNSSDWQRLSSAGAIYSSQFRLALPLTVAFAPLRETEHTLKYKSGESRHIRSPTPPCRTINHRRTMPITLSPPGSSLHSLPCIQPSLRKVSLSFLKNVQFLSLQCICQCGTF